MKNTYPKCADCPGCDYTIEKCPRAVEQRRKTNLEQFAEISARLELEQYNKLIGALEFAAAGFAVIANDKTTEKHTRAFALSNFNQAKAAIMAAGEGP